jgi:hypothetical protein
LTVSTVTYLNGFASGRYSNHPIEGRPVRRGALAGRPILPGLLGS